MALSAAWLLCFSFGAALAAPDDAAALLSRYPSGQVPSENIVFLAIDELSRAGTTGDVPILRDLVATERPEVRDAAMRAIAQIRARQRDASRAAFARSLPDWPQITEAAAPWAAEGHGREAAACAGYAALVLGAPPRDVAWPSEPWRAARAHEDRGDATGAVRAYARLAVDGAEEARLYLDGYGVDVERLMLGLIVDADRADPQIVEHLVRSGGALTVAVLAERAAHARPAASAEAIDALGRMIARSEAPLPVAAEREARRALRQASLRAPAPLAALADEALAE